MLAISAELLRTRRSLTRGLRGSALVGSKTLAKPSDFVGEVEKKREKADLAAGFWARSVKTAEAEEVRGERRDSMLLMSPV